MASVTATINVQINAANAAGQLAALQGKVAALNKGLMATTTGGVIAQEKALRRMSNVLNSSGMFTTGIRNVHTEMGLMHKEFDRGVTSLQNYRKNSYSWSRDHSSINRLAADRVRMLQSQYIALGKEMNGVQRAMEIKPDRMMREFGADAEFAHQKAVLFRRNLQMGSTALVNWGKNTQWAGRQMMVGMGVPVAIAAAGSIKAFNDIEKASIAFKRVYGDATTSVAEKSQMLATMQKTVGREMLKYGVSMANTMDVASQAAATGAKGADLIAATRETMRLATLGNMDYNKALEATIAMQTAFNIKSQDMAKTTDFLNAVENQTILTMEDMALAVPRVAPVIKGLGGNVEELAIMMTALRQGGVSAEQGANALKSGLGSLLNPTGTAIDQFDSLGINLKKIVDTNKGDLIGTVQGLGKALDGLTKYDRQRALESLFGKYQYARMGALLKNINSKAVKETMRLATANSAELAKMSSQELEQISDSPMIKLKASIEELKVAAAPLGALFSDIGAAILKIATPVVSFFSNNSAAKWGAAITAGVVLAAGALTMIVGVLANFTGMMVKAGMSVQTFFRFLTGQRSLAYVATDELKASAAANSLASSADRAAAGMMAEANAAKLLISQLEQLAAVQLSATSSARVPTVATPARRIGTPATNAQGVPFISAPQGTYPSSPMRIPMSLPLNTRQNVPTPQQRAQTSVGSTYYGMLDSWDKKTQAQVASARQEAAAKISRSAAGGAIAAGLIGSTVVMGLQAAGKELPPAVNVAVAGLTSAGFAMQMMPGQTEKLMRGVGLVASKMGPWGVAIGAVVATAVGASLLWKKFNEDTRRQGIELGKGLNDTTSSIKDVGTAFGKTAYVQEQAAKDQGTTTEALSTAQQFMESEVGKKLIDRYYQDSASIGQNVAGTSLAAKLASYVVSGVMDATDVRSYLAALKMENPAIGAQIERYTQGLMGPKLNKKPGTLATDIYDTQTDNTATTLKLLRQQKDSVANQSLMDVWSKQSLPEKAVRLLSLANPLGGYKELGSLMATKQMEIRGATNRVGGLMASATNSQIESGLQNRLSLEAQLNMLLDERKTLQDAADKGAISDEDSARLKYINKVIPDVRTGLNSLDKSLNVSRRAMLEFFDQNPDGQGAFLESLKTMVNESGDAIAILMADMTMAREEMSEHDKASILTSLQNKSLDPAGMQNMITYSNTGWQGVTNAINDLPVAKLQSFSLEVGKMTGTQAQAALTSFGSRFITAARAAKLSGTEAAKAAKALGADQPTQQRVKLKVETGKVDDVTKGMKKDIKVSASTEQAQGKLKKLADHVSKVTGKKVKINSDATVDQTVRKLKRVLKQAIEVDGVDPTVKTSTNAPSTGTKLDTLQGKIDTIAGVEDLSISLGIVDQATPAALIAGDTLDTVANNPYNPFINVTTNAPEAASSAISSINSVPNESVKWIVVKTRKDSAAGGPFNEYAAGGVHKGAGKVSGPGGPTEDKVNARLSDGEFVIRASSVKKYGTSFMHAVNQGMYDKNGFARGTPGNPIKAAPLPPKDKKGDSAKVQFSNEWQQAMYEARQFVMMFGKMKGILSHGRAVLGKQFKSLDYEFSRWIMDNYSLPQIKKMFAGKADKGARQMAAKYRAEQKLQDRDEFRSQDVSLRNAKLRNQLLASRGAFGQDSTKADVISGLSDEQLSLINRLKPKKRDKYIDTLVKTEKVRKEHEKQNETRERKEGVSKQYDAATGRELVEASGKSGWSPAQLISFAEDLGMSVSDLAQQIKDGDLPTNLDQLARAAKETSKAIEQIQRISQMTQGEKDAQMISNRQSMIGNYQDKAAAAARLSVAKQYGKSQTELEAQMALTEAQNAIDQAAIDDINDKYSKQLEIFDQIAQQQQAIANLERGRLSVANALSVGDIAAAAAAAQQQRSDTAAFMQQQMRTQIENQQKAQTSVLQEQINARVRENRDIQNQINLAVAKANEEIAATVGSLQTQNDQLMTTPAWIDDANAALVEENRLLAMTNDELAHQLQLKLALAAVANVPAAPEEVTLPASGGAGTGSARTTRGNQTNRTTRRGKKGKAFGGMVPGVGNYDSVPIMATPGEFVVRKAAVAKFGPELRAINAGSFMKNAEYSGGSRNIGQVIFNINGTNLNEREVAMIAVREMNRLDSGTIKTGRF